jgi:signal transduction histidine kinase
MLTELKPGSRRAPRMLIRSRVQEKFLFPALLILIALNMTAAIIAAGSLRYFTVARDDARQSTNTNIELANVYSSMRDAESGQRGYLLTNNQLYLAPYNSGVKAVHGYLAQLQPQYKNTQHASEMSQVNQLSQAKLQELAETIHLRDAQGLNVALVVVNSNKGIVIMNDLHSLLSTMEQQDDTKAAARDHTASVFSTVAYGSLVASLAFTLALAYFVRIIFRQSKIQSKLLENTNAELERSNRELEDFASIASHDLQEPLRKIQAFGDRLAIATDLSDDSQLYLDRMLSAAGRMRVLIDDLLSYSRVTTKAKPFKRVSLKRIVQEVISDMEIRIGETGTKIRVSQLPAIEADVTQLRQLFQNLISNAIKFRSEGAEPRIKIYSTVDTTGGRNTVTVSVADNGIGFDQKYEDRIFTIFQRLHGRNEYEGTGIGLAVVRKIAERHGGTVAAKSKVGEGSRFDIILPIQHKDT